MNRLAAHSTPQATSTVALSEAPARILAESINAPIAVPSFASSMMDGYAMRASDWQNAECGYPIHQRIVAGSSPQALMSGSVARIFTGAPLPEGADCVIAQENCYEENGKVWINDPPKAGQYVHSIGQDIRPHDLIAKCGEVLTPARLGMLASVGISAVPVFNPLRIALVTTGYELINPGAIPATQLPHGKIFNSNQTMLESLLRSWGGVVRSVSLGDDRATIAKTLAQLSTQNDLIVTAGGASVGEEDHIHSVLAEQGELLLWKLAIKPGKPFMFAQLPQSNATCCWVAGLPGNPVAAFVTAYLIVRPIVQFLQGQLAWNGEVHSLLPAAVMAKAQFDWLNPDPLRREFLRVKAWRHPINGEIQLSLLPNQKSNALSSLVYADGLIDHPAGKIIRHGDACRYMPF